MTDTNNAIIASEDARLYEQARHFSGLLTTERRRIAELEATLLSEANEVLSAIGKRANEIEHCVLEQPECGGPDHFIGSLSYDLSRNARSVAERIRKELGK